MTVPHWPERGRLREACDTAFERKVAFAAQAEKDFALGRLLWGYGEEFGEQLLLKGGTCLSKVDLRFHRISEDADFVLPMPTSQDDLAVPKLFAGIIPRLRTAAGKTGFEMEKVPATRQTAEPCDHGNSHTSRFMNPMARGMSGSRSVSTMSSCQCAACS